jgi:Tol biopolymer transport system component
MGLNLESNNTLGHTRGKKLLLNPRVLLVLFFSTVLLFSCSPSNNQPFVQTPAQGGSATTEPQPSILQPTLASSTPQSTKIRIPVTWGSLSLTGKLVFMGADLQQGNPLLNIQVLDLHTGEISTIFQTTGESWIYYMTASPDRQQIVMSYSPPSGANSAQQALYSLPLDGSNLPQLLFSPPTPDDQYTQAEFSPDGKYLYFVHYVNKPQYTGQLYPVYEILRMAYPDGQPEKIAQNAFWPRLSLDSSQIVYISSDPIDGKNRLFVAGADGTNSHEVILRGPRVPDIIDAPIFSPDGQSILFSAPPPANADQPNWLDKLLGLQVAQAHSIPSEWWSVPSGGGIPLQLTHIQSPVLFATIAPDKQFIASYSGFGLFVMKPDGTGEASLIPDLGGLAGTVNWLP